VQPSLGAGRGGQDRGWLAGEVVAGEAGLRAVAHARWLGPAAHEPADILERVGDAFLVEAAIGPQQGHVDAGLLTSRPTYVVVVCSGMVWGE